LFQVANSRNKKSAIHWAAMDSGFLCFKYGIQEVSGSIPLISTKDKNQKTL